MVTRNQTVVRPRTVKRAQCQMTTEFLLGMLNVRDDIQLVGVNYDPRREIISLYLKGESLPETPEGQESLCIELPVKE